MPSCVDSEALVSNIQIFPDKGSVSIKAGETKTLFIQLLDKEGKGVNNKKVEIEIRDKDVIQFSDPKNAAELKITGTSKNATDLNDVNIDGLVSFQIKIHDNHAGNIWETQISVKSLEDDGSVTDDASDLKKFEIKIKRQTDDILLLPDSGVVELIKGQTIELFAIALDSSNRGINGQPLFFMLDGTPGFEFSDSGKTGESIVFETTSEIDMNGALTVGASLIRVRYTGDASPMPEEVNLFTGPAAIDGSTDSNLLKTYKIKLKSPEGK